jgi:hypothetical protein
MNGVNGVKPSLKASKMGVNPEVNSEVINPKLDIGRSKLISKEDDG